MSICDTVSSSYITNAFYYNSTLVSEALGEGGVNDTTHNKEKNVGFCKSKSSISENTNKDTDKTDKTKNPQKKLWMWFNI